MNNLDYTSEVKATLIDSLASDIDVARAAWVSNYGEEAREKDPKAIEGLIKFLYNNKHMSPFEHGIFKFFIDCPIFVAREFMRHRTFSFNEVSGRYKTLNGKFYVPDASRPLVQKGKVGAYTFEPGTDEMYALKRASDMRAFESAWTEYQYQLQLGIAKETARNVLPVGIYTQFYASVDPRNLMQFLTLRNDKHALYEIRQIAEQMEDAFAEKMPLTYKAYATAREKERYPVLVVSGADFNKPPLDIPPTFANGGLVCDGKGEIVYYPNHKIYDGEGNEVDKNHRWTAYHPDWDNYQPKHRKGSDHEPVNFTININAPKSSPKEIADLVRRTDRFGRRKLEK